MATSINKNYTHSIEHGMTERRSGERRRSADKWTYMLRGLSGISWAFFVIACLLNFYANDNIEAQHILWQSLVNNLYIVLWISAFSGYLCLVVARYRSRRSKDSKHLNITMLLIFAFGWSTYLLTGA